MSPAEPKPLGVRVERHADGPTLLSVSGEVDMTSSLRLRQAIESAVADGAAGVIVSLAEVTYMDSSGVAVLIEGYKWSEAAGRPYVLAAVSRPVYRVLEMAYLTDILKILDTVDEAARACRAKE